MWITFLSSLVLYLAQFYFSIYIFLMYKVEVLKLLKYLVIFFGTIVTFVAGFIFELVFHKSTRDISDNWKYLLYYFLILCVLFFIAYWTFPNIFFK